jgi:glycosyltransferase involved in cell wall biosynthesis
MASGVIVLATAVGGIPDLVKPNATGFLLPNNTPECIANNILGVLDSEQLDELAVNAYQLILQNYSYDAIVMKYDGLLKALTQRNLKSNAE